MTSDHQFNIQPCSFPSIDFWYSDGNLIHVFVNNVGFFVVVIVVVVVVVVVLAWLIFFKIKRTLKLKSTNRNKKIYFNAI